MNFDDLVKERISKSQLLEREKPTIEERIRKNADEVAEYIKTTILLAAEKSLSERFIYSGLLCFSDLPYKKRDNFDCGVIDYSCSTTTHKHLLCANTKICKEIYTLNHNSEIFLSALQNTLKGTGIKTDWKVCLLYADTDYDLPEFVAPPELKFIGSRCAFLFVPQQDKAYSLCSGPFQYTKPVECIRTYDVIRSEKFRSWEWNYSSDVFHNSEWCHPTFYLCISVDYKN